MEALRQPPQCLGVSQEQKSPRGKRAFDPRGQSLGLLRREVHHHVAAEDDVEPVRLPKKGIVINEVAFLDTHHGTDFVIEDVVPTTGVKPPISHILPVSREVTTARTGRVGRARSEGVHVNAGHNDVET